MRLLALDVGKKRIGLAICDEEGRVATPLHTLNRRGGKADLDAIAEVVTSMSVEGLVAGLPLTLEGREGGAARQARRFADKVGAHLGWDVHYVDERFTSVQAERALLEADVSRKKRRDVVDAIAASLILQAYLDGSGRAQGQP
ncbi:MAG: Holliday junction resolvase RuvX [Deltaproteobacteria bacterium]|nr:Holliday junction resolvase RuvX [Deltaproteobacteria bacterium]